MVSHTQEHAPLPRRRSAPWLRRPATGGIAVAALSLLAFTGCTVAPSDFTEPLELDGQVVASVEQLNRGKEDYTTYCMQCHGRNGDGKGVSAAGLWPPPRDFTAGQFKFEMVEQGELPPDSELLRIVKGGLHGTPMRPWDISDERLLDVIQYIKTFDLDDWDDTPGDIIEMEPDPYADDHEAGAERGKLVYHGYANCQQCHPAYATPETIQFAQQETTGTMRTVELRENWHRSLPKETNYGAWAMPPDFTWHPLRTVDPKAPREDQVTAITRILAAGVDGAGMPAWKFAMTDEDMWAIGHYVYDLTLLRGHLQERREFWAELGVDPAEDTAMVVREAPEAPAS